MITFKYCKMKRGRGETCKAALAKPGNAILIACSYSAAVIFAEVAHTNNEYSSSFVPIIRGTCIPKIELIEK
jgi:hypothetical protein